MIFRAEVCQIYVFLSFWWSLAASGTSICKKILPYIEKTTFGAVRCLGWVFLRKCWNPEKMALVVIVLKNKNYVTKWPKIWFSFVNRSKFQENTKKLFSAKEVFFLKVAQNSFFVFCPNGPGEILKIVGVCESECILGNVNIFRC